MLNKTMKQGLLYTLFVVLFSLTIAAQNDLSPGKWRFVVHTPCEMFLRVDSLSIVPGSFCAYDVPDSVYILDPVSATMYLRDSSLLGRPLLMSYTVFNVDFSAPLSHRDFQLVRTPVVRPLSPAAHLTPTADLSDESRLSSTGSLSRGVSVGNNSDLVLNSSLNLQLSGRLSDDVSILASITDKNIPIQPEGTTQNIRDINSIFINIYFKDLAAIKAGDLEMKAPSSTFMVVSRNLLGLYCSLRTNPGRGLSMENVLGGGVAKGKFVRQTITPQNGVQGPYKLYGKDNEYNIVVVAGSERVYVDGALLTRGQDHDYVIDYNTGEITFTPAMLVTSEKRIVVEMEYSDRHFARYNLYSFNRLDVGENKRWRVEVGFYQEQDLKNQSIQPELTDAEKRFLATLGDEESMALYPRADTMSFSPDRILYCKKDSVVDGVLYRDLYVHSTDENAVLYSISFSYVGPGKGNYSLLRSTANGRVFGWVAPGNGVCQGEYEPVVQLTMPSLMQMATVAANYNSGKGTTLHTEMALSNSDRNTFSELDDRDNVGFAYTLHAQHLHRLGRDTTKVLQWRLSSDLDWQFVHRNFTPVESFREVEFARNFNLENDYADTCSENLLNVRIALERPDGQLVGYSFDWLSRVGTVNGFRQKLNAKLRTAGFAFQTNTSLLLAHDAVQRSDFWTSDNRISYGFKKLEIGVTDLVEHNVFNDTRADTIRANSYAFNELIAYLKSRDSSWCNYELSYKNRLEYLPSDSRLSLAQRIHELSGRLQIEKIRNQRFLLQGTYRNQLVAQGKQQREAEHYFVGNAEYNGRFCKNVLLLNTYYEAGTGLELERTYTFLKVSAGQGTHMWVDYDEDGIEDLGEFEVSAFHDVADYVKVWLSGTEYVNTYNSQFSQSVQLRPAAAWAGKRGVRRFVSRFADVAMFRANVKQGNPGFNPFKMDLEDTNLVAKTMVFNNTLTFNNSSSPFAFDFIVQSSQNKELLYYGYESSRNNTQRLVLKSAPCRALQLMAEGEREVRASQSQSMPGKNYCMLQYEASGQVQMQLQNKYLASFSYGFADKRNVQGEEHVRQHDIDLTLSVKMARKGVLSGMVRYVGITGEPGGVSSVAYQMLQGLNVGDNLVWNFSFQMALSGYLQLALQYDGRASQGRSAIHTGNVTVKAQF